MTIIKSLFEKCFLKTKKCKTCGKLPRIEKWGNLFHISCGVTCFDGVRILHGFVLGYDKKESIKKWNRDNK
jgi:hypothetical protein